MRNAAAVVEELSPLVVAQFLLSTLAVHTAQR